LEIKKNLMILTLIIFMVGSINGEKIKDLRHINVTRPVEGEIIYKKNPIKITWKAVGIKGNVSILMMLPSLDGSWTIKAEHPVDKSPFYYTWDRFDFRPGQYVIGIKNQKMKKIWYSGVFNIKIRPQDIRDSRSLSVSSPKGGKVFYTSGQLPIVWKSIGIFGKIKIVLRKHDDTSGKQLLIRILTSGTSSYNHPLGDIAPGRYFVRIKHIGSTIKAESGVFTISKK
jgi:hypothetical protein